MTDRHHQSDRHTQREHTYIQPHTNRNTDGYIQTHTYIYRQADRQRDRQTDNTDTVTQADNQMQIGSQRQTVNHRKTFMFRARHKDIQR